MRIVVLESRGQWATALRHELGGPPLTICETRSITECEAELTTAPASFVVAELIEPSAESLLERIAAWRRRFPTLAVAVVAARKAAKWEGIVREAGAAVFLTSPRRLGSIIATLKRHAARMSQPPRSAAERIWADLPLA